MNKSGILSVCCLMTLTMFAGAFAQEEVSILLGKDVKEWHAIAAALISEGRHDESIKYYDKILEINPDHVKALASKGIALSFLDEWDLSEELIFRAVELEPENKIIQGMMYQFMSYGDSVIAHDSIYDINFRATVRDSSGNLVSVSESSNTRYLPYPITEEIFEKHLINKGVIIDVKMYDIAQRVGEMTVDGHLTGAFTFTVTKYGHELDIFLGFVPMVLTEPGDKITTEWKILKEII